MRKLFTSRSELRGAIGEALIALLVTITLVWIAIYFRHYIATYVGETVTALVGSIFILGVVIMGTQPALDVIDGCFRVRNQEAAEKRLQAECEREDQEERSEWDAFINWIKQNPTSAERLMRIVDDEQSLDQDHAQWRCEQREAAGGLINRLFDQMRLFDWLKAQRDLQRFGHDVVALRLPRNQT